MALSSKSVQRQVAADALSAAAVALATNQALALPSVFFLYFASYSKLPLTH
jgi:hypothetical protein